MLKSLLTNNINKNILYFTMIVKLLITVHSSFYNKDSEEFCYFIKKKRKENVSINIGNVGRGPRGP